MLAKAFVLLSGGIDSTTCLYQAMQDFNGNVEGVSIHYGQRHSNEIEHARDICAVVGFKWSLLDLSSVVPRSMLTDTSKTAPAIPNKSYDDIKGVSPTFVPFRNGLMISALASYAHGQYPKSHSEAEQLLMPEWGLYIGTHAEDAHNWAYPDCTPEFTGAMANAIYVGTYRQLRLHMPLQWLTKDRIIKLGTELGVPWHLTWSCYAGGEKHCGTCPTCRARRAGFHKAGVMDPTKYAAEAA